MGKLIGSIKEGIGFVPNNSYTCDADITTIDYGEYAITLAYTEKVLDLLKACFNAQNAVAIYVISIIHFIHGFTYLKDLKEYYDMSYLLV